MKDARIVPSDECIFICANDTGPRSAPWGQSQPAPAREPSDPARRGRTCVYEPAVFQVLRLERPGDPDTTVWGPL